jgi:uncharacterized membrane protein YebE (DUF533 family)
MLLLSDQGSTMQRDNLKLVQPTEDRPFERIRSAVDELVQEKSDGPDSGPNGIVSYRMQRRSLMAEPVVLAAIGSALAIGRKVDGARQAASTLDLYALGLPETRRSRIVQHASHPQRPMWLASGVGSQRLALWMYATCRTLMENTARSRVFLEDLAEALRIPVRDVRILKQKLPLREPLAG